MENTPYLDDTLLGVLGQHSKWLDLRHRFRLEAILPLAPHRRYPFVSEARAPPRSKTVVARGRICRFMAHHGSSGRARTAMGNERSNAASL